MIKVAVVDDHPLYRDGVAATLKSVPDFVVVGVGGSGVDALDLVQEHKPDLILLDLNMPGGGIPLIRKLIEAHPKIKPVMLTISGDQEFVSEALREGVRGYILKQVNSRDLISALQSVYAGDPYVMPELAAKLLKHLGSRPVPDRRDKISGLSAREMEILERVANGSTNKEIARDLKITEKTVKHYMTTIMQKLQVRNRVEAAAMVLQNGAAPHHNQGGQFRE
jgi:DNA-binding NarL/FixJ family response regulator